MPTGLNYAGSQFGNGGSRKAGGAAPVTVPNGRRVDQETLKALLDQHHRYVRGVPGGRKMILRGCDLSGLRAEKACFDGAEMLGCRFSNARFAGSSFSHANLFGARFDNADLRATNFERADLRGACLDGANLLKANFSQADLRPGEIITDKAKKNAHRGGPVTFTGASLKSANLGEARLKDASFAEAEIENTNLAQCDLRGVKFHKTRIAGSDLTGAHMSETDFAGASLDAKARQTASLVYAVNAYAAPSMGKVNDMLTLHEAWLQSGGKKGQRADFTRMDLSGIDLGRRILAAAIFHETILVGAMLDGANLAAADLRGANLMHASLIGAEMRGADLRGACTRFAKMDGMRAGQLGETGLQTRVEAAG